MDGRKRCKTRGPYQAYISLFDNPWEGPDAEGVFSAGRPYYRKEENGYEKKGVKPRRMAPSSPLQLAAYLAQ